MYIVCVCWHVLPCEPIEYKLPTSLVRFWPRLIRFISFCYGFFVLWILNQGFYKQDLGNFFIIVENISKPNRSCAWSVMQSEIFINFGFYFKGTSWSLNCTTSLFFAFIIRFCIEGPGDLWTAPYQLVRKSKLNLNFIILIWFHTGKLTFDHDQISETFPVFSSTEFYSFDEFFRAFTL